MGTRYCFCCGNANTHFSIPETSLVRCRACKEELEWQQFYVPSVIYEQEGKSEMTKFIVSDGNDPEEPTRLQLVQVGDLIQLDAYKPKAGVRQTLMTLDRDGSIRLSKLVPQAARKLGIRYSQEDGQIVVIRQ